jgi:hypothetical protein
MLIDPSLNSILLPLAISIGTGMAGVCLYFLKRIATNTDVTATLVNTVKTDHEVLKVRVDQIEETVDEHDRLLKILPCYICPENETPDPRHHLKKQF